MRGQGQSGHEARLDLLRAVDNPQGFRDHGAARERCAPASPRGLGLPQRFDHGRLQAAPGMRVDRGVDRFVADAASGIIRFHGLQPARDLLRRPAEMNKPVTDPAVEPATLDQLARPPAPTPPDLVNRTSDLRTVAAVLTLATPQFPADRARSPAQKPPDCPKTRARLRSAKIMPRSSWLRCPYRLPIATTPPGLGKGVALAV